jgi:hypothetical protein
MTLLPSGFIVLIVGLCVIILTSTVAIYFLLRKEISSGEELAKRHKSSHKARYGVPADDVGSQPKFWHPNKHRRFFFTRTVSINDSSLLSLLMNQVREGLPVQSVDDLQSQAPQPSGINWMTSPDKRGSTLAVSTSHGSNIRTLASPISASSIQFDTHDVKVNLPPERDRFAPSPSIPPSQIHTYLSTPSAPSSPTMPLHRLGHSIPANMSLAPSSTPPAQHEQDIALRTIASSGPTTFKGGSRFLETF